MTSLHSHGISFDRKTQQIIPVALALLLPAVLKFFVQLIFIDGYGLNSDELYYLACSDNLDWGYVDQPPLSIVLLHLQRMMSGDSLLSIRFLSALAGFFTVFFTTLLARRMGAGIFGQVIAGLCALVAPVYLAINHIFSMNAFDIAFWVAGMYLMVGILKDNAPKRLLWLGLLMGIGFQNKISVLFLCFGLVSGLLLTKQRTMLFTRWFWLGVGAAILIAMPNIFWQIQNGWPTIEWMHNARTMKNASLSIPAFLIEQVILMQPMTVVVWVAGLLSLILSPSLKRLRALGWCYIIVFAVFVSQGGKAYYLAGAYPVLFASGALVWERWLAKDWMKAMAVTVLLVAGILTAPIGLPVLSVERFIAYQEAIGLRPSSGERHEEGVLPDFYANMFGWPKLTDMVDTVYHSLPLKDQEVCGILCQNYSQAGAIDFYGRTMGLPHAITSHNSYWLWGMRGYTGDVLIVVGNNAAYLGQFFEEVTEMARFHDEYVSPNNNNIPIFLARKPKQPLRMLHSSLKEYL